MEALGLAVVLFLLISGRRRDRCCGFPRFTVESVSAKRAMFRRPQGEEAVKQGPVCGWHCLLCCSPLTSEKKEVALHGRCHLQESRSGLAGKGCLWHEPSGVDFPPGPSGHLYAPIHSMELSKSAGASSLWRSLRSVNGITVRVSSDVRQNPA